MPYIEKLPHFETFPMSEKKYCRQIQSTNLWASSLERLTCARICLSK